MKPKNYLTLDKEFIQYCELNGIENIEQFAEQVFNRGFTIVKYGEVPMGLSGGTEIIEKEVIREITKEVPVEKIVEVIKEVEVEKIVTKEVEIPIEVIVEKEIYITDDEQVKELGGKIAELEREKKELSNKLSKSIKDSEKFSTKTSKTENIFQKEMSKKDEELDKLRHSLDILTKERDTIKTELDTLKTSLNNLGKRAKYMKGSDMSNLYGE